MRMAVRLIRMANVKDLRYFLWLFMTKIINSLVKKERITYLII